MYYFETSATMTTQAARTARAARTDVWFTTSLTLIFRQISAVSGFWKHMYNTTKVWWVNLPNMEQIDVLSMQYTNR